MHRPGAAGAAHELEDRLRALGGVDWANVDQVLGRVVVAFDEDETGVEELVDVIEAVEDAHDLAGGEFVAEHTGHPGDREPLLHQRSAIAADLLGAATGVAARFLRANPVSSEAAALVGLVEATPRLRRPLENRLGPAADFGLATVHAAAQAFAGSSLPLVVDAVHRGLVLRELNAARDAWERREGELFDEDRGGSAAVDHHTPATGGGLQERYAERSSAAAFAGAVLALAATRDPRLAVAATVAGNPKAARVGVEAFASVLGVRLAEQGVLPMDRTALRRLDRVDTVVLDADVLLTGRWSLGAVWVPPEVEQDPEEVERRWLHSRLLFDPDDPSATGVADGWTLAPVTERELGGDRSALDAWRLLRHSGGGVVCLRRSGVGERRSGPAALVAVEPRLDPLAGVLAEAARSTGVLLVGGLRSGLADRLRAGGEVRGGTALAGEVRRLRDEGRVVAVVSTRQHAALAAGDVGIGVHRPPTRPPWGADLVTSRGLLDAWLVLQAVPVARSVVRRSVECAAYGAGAAGLAALAGPRRGATTRAGIAVNTAAAASLGLGAWSARRLLGTPAPVGEDPSEWHAMAAADVLRQLDTRAEGLSREEVEDRLGRRAPVVDEEEAVGVLRATLEELGNPLTPALAAGAGLSVGLGSLTDAGLISGVMGLSAVVGGLQRVGADRALQRLLDTGRPRVHVRRNGVEVLIDVERLVVGDIVVLHPGDAVPADCRVVEAEAGFEVDESSLTGESQSVAKSTDASAAKALADRRSMVYEGTAVAAGRATVVVVALGADTEMGRSARSAATLHRRSGVERRLQHLTSRTLPLALGAGAGLVGAGLLHGRRLTDTLGTGVGLAIAAVPEGLPFVATVAQLASARRLSQRDTLVRHPATIEALGRVDVLCADKTGTLTTGRISVRRVWDGAGAQELSALDGQGRQVLAAALRATPRASRAGQVAHPTDRAVLEAAGEVRVTRRAGRAGWRLEAELPFEPARSYHAVLGRAGERGRLSVKGSPEVVVPRCSTWHGDATTRELDEAGRAEIRAEADRLARQGYRVLAVAEREASDRGDLDDERLAGLELLGLLAMADPVRPSAAEAVRGLGEAGVRVVMITGDHPSTAEAIAAELGLVDGGGVLTGADLDRCSDEELAERVDRVAVFARVSPSQKVRVVRALQARGLVVAMTGDGANDAAAIRLADVGVALGSHATNAAKDAADVVVTDDRIETIIEAILEGRAMWASVRDAVSVLLGGNLGEIVFTLGAELLLPGGSPLNARQLLLVNLLTDLVPSMALAVRPPAGTDPARLAREGPEASLGPALTRDVLVRGGLTATAAGLGWQAGRLTGVTRGRAGTVALVSLVGSQLGQTLAAGWRDPLVVGSTVASAAALAGVVQTPGLSHFFGCRPLGPVGWAIGGAATAGSCVMAPVVNHVVGLAGAAGRSS